MKIRLMVAIASLVFSFHLHAELQTYEESNTLATSNPPYVLANVDYVFHFPKKKITAVFDCSHEQIECTTFFYGNWEAWEIIGGLAGELRLDARSLKNFQEGVRTMHTEYRGTQHGIFRIEDTEYASTGEKLRTKIVTQANGRYSEEISEYFYSSDGALLEVRILDGISGETLSKGSTPMTEFFPFSSLSDYAVNLTFIVQEGVETHISLDGLREEGISLEAVIEQVLCPCCHFHGDHDPQENPSCFQGCRCGFWWDRWEDLGWGAEKVWKWIKENPEKFIRLLYEIFGADN